MIIKAVETMAMKLARKRWRQQLASKYVWQKLSVAFYDVKINKMSDGVSLADRDKSKATGEALTVKTDTAALISTKDNEM